MWVIWKRGVDEVAREAHIGALYSTQQIVSDGSESLVSAYKNACREGLMPDML